MADFDVVVLGVGGVGSAALYQLARRGSRVLGIEQYSIGHDRGSSHGHTRIIRQAYFEHPNYVPLLVRAYALWDQLERETGRTLMHRCGLLEVGAQHGALLAGVLRSAAQFQLPVLEFNAKQAAARFPQFRIPADYHAVFERTAGYLLVEDCVQALVDAAVQQRAQILSNTHVAGWRAEPSEIRIALGTDTVATRRLIICAGAWSANWLPLPFPLRVLRKHLYWFRADRTAWQAENGGCTFLFELPGGTFYGFPSIAGRGVKAGEHSGGEIVADPSRLDRALDPHDHARVTTFVQDHLLHVDSTTFLDRTVCMYTMSPDEHFLVDRYPEDSRIAFAAGLSGHGFKFAPVLGLALCELILDGGTDLPIEFLSLRRFSGQSSQ